MGGDRRAGYTAARFAADLNTIHPGIVRVTNGRPHQLYHARRGAMQVPRSWAPVVHELRRLARIGFTMPSDSRTAPAKVKAVTRDLGEAPGTRPRPRRWTRSQIAGMGCAR